MKKILLPVLAGFFMLFSQTSKASHVMGADLSFQCVGADSFLVTLTLYRNCSGIAVSSSYSLNAISTSCGQNFSFTVNQVGSGEDITPLCASDLANDLCNNPSGIYQGVQQYFFTGIVHLPVKCTDWIISFYTCCRNASITNIVNPASDGIYVECNINNTLAKCDNSPLFTNPPVPYFCDNVPANYNQGAFDPDGDSMVFVQINPMDFTTVPVPIAYVTPFTSTYPLTTTPVNAFGFDPASGEMSFTPSGTQITCVAVRVDEYRAGVKIGYTMRDMQFVIINCTSNTTPGVIPGTVTGGVLDTSGTIPTIITCPGNNLNFSLIGSDPNNLLNLYFNSNINTVIPASSYYTNGDNPDTTFISWVPGIGDSGNHYFTITLQNDACPTTSTQIFAFDIYVSNGLKIGPPISICPSAPAQLLATNSGTYSWTPNVDLSNDTISNPIATPTVTTSYIVTGNLPPGCKNTDTEVVQVDTFHITMGPTMKFCKGDSTLLNPTGGGSLFTWSPATGLSCSTCSSTEATPTVTTTYNLTATDANGCKNTDSEVVIVNPVPVPLAGPNQSLCFGFSGSLSVTSGFNSYVWSPSTGLSSSTITNPVATPTATITYTVTVTDTNGCTGKDSTIITIYPYIAPTTVTSASYCQNAGATLDGGAGTAWSWSPAVGLSSTNIQNPVANPTATTTYYVTITDANGCLTKDSVIVTVFPPIVPTISKDTSINKYSSVNLLATGGVSYVWSPATGLSSSTVNNPTATPLINSTYYVTITDSDGCVTTDSVEIIVIDGCQGVIMPNAFTPNGDGRNDVIYAENPGIYNKLLYLRIYNRWGQLIFSTDDITQGWDGRFNGVMEPVGTYVYITESICNGKTAMTEGNITLLR